MAHPVLFFNESELTALRAKVSGDMSGIWSAIINKANAIEAAGFTPGMPGATDNLFIIPSQKIYICALAYVVTLTAKYLTFSVNYMLDMATWTYWGGENSSYLWRDFSLQYMIRGVAKAYDWLYPYMSAENRTTIRNKLAIETEKMYEASVGPKDDDWNNFWWNTFNHNHWTTNNSALGVASLVLVQDEVEDSDIWLAQAVSQVTRLKEVLDGMDDGAWHEGIQYQTALEIFMVEFLWNYEKINSIDLYSDWFEKSIDYNLYNFLYGSSNDLVATGDYIWDSADVGNAMSGIFLTALASKYASEEGQWLANSKCATYPWYPDADDSAYWVYRFLYYDSSVSATAPDIGTLGNYRYYEDKGIVIWRTGWGATDLAFSLKCGEIPGAFLKNKYLTDEDYSGVYGGHDHPDALTFSLYVGGADLASEYCENYYPPHPAYHNNVLINDAPQYHNDWGRIFDNEDAVIDNVTNTANYLTVICNATQRYKVTPASPATQPTENLTTNLKRYFIIDKINNWILISDNIQCASAKELTFRIFGCRGETITVDGDWIKLPSTGTNVLGICVIAPASFTTATGTVGTKPYVDIIIESSADSRFTVLLWPTDETGFDTKPTIASYADNVEQSNFRVE